MLSDLSIRRPVLATVFSLLIIAFGAIAFFQLPLRELPDVDRPVVSIDVTYRGASAQVIETQVTRVIEDQLSGVEGVDGIESTSRDGRASVNVEFLLSRNLEDAAADVRDAVSRAQGNLPDDADPPVVAKADADADPILWINLFSDRMTQLELTDYAERNIVDRLSVIDGVANLRIGGSQRPSLRIWVDPDALAARGLTVDDVETALRSQNVELPAGQVQGAQRDYAVRVERAFLTPSEFARMAIRVDGANVVRLGDVARVEIAPDEERRLFRGNGVNQIGIGVVRQSKANALSVGEAIKTELERLRVDLPEGVQAVVAFDSTVFIARAIEEVWRALAEALFLVVVVIFLFLGSARAAAIPAAVIPVCLVGAFAVLAMLGFSINLLTLLALVLSIGLVVDDSIIVLENAQRRVDEFGEPAPVAAMRGTRQVFFAVIATSAVLIAVFTPLLFVGGVVGRMFIELAATVAAVVAISAFCALSLTPMMCSKLLRPVTGQSRLVRATTRLLDASRTSYRATLDWALGAKPVVIGGFLATLALGGLLFAGLPGEITPREDRGNMRISMDAPQGVGFEYARDVMSQAEAILMTYVERGEAERVLVVAPGFGDMSSARFNSGFGRIFLVPWEERDRSGAEILDEINRRLGEIPGAIFRARMDSAFQQRGGGDDVSLTLVGADQETLAPIADRVIARARAEAPWLVRPRMNYEPNAPRVLVAVDRERAAALGVSVQAIGRTLESTMGVRRVTTIPDRGEEYDILMQAERSARSEIADLSNRYVRSSTTGELIPLDSLVRLTPVGDSAERRRLNRQAEITIGGGLSDGATIGEGLDWLERVAREEIGQANVALDYTGNAKQFKEQSGALLFTFAFALVIVFLVLAAQFESFVHPFTIMLTVPLALTGGLLGLWLGHGTLNIYSQIGLVILIALAAKNGILIVEFANQLRDEGRSVREAILEASDLRLRPILMTSIATVLGAVPLMLGDGAGGESRAAIGVVIVFGVTIATLLTLFVVPVFYDLLARFTRSPEAVTREIEAWEKAAETPAE